MGEDLEAGADGAAFCIVAAVNDTGNSRLNDGASAHAARLNRYIQSRTGEAIVAEGTGCFAQHHDFGVRCWMAIADSAIRATRYECSVAVAHNHSADRDFAGRRRGTRFFERDLHE